MLSENPARTIFETIVAIDPQQVKKIRVRQMDDIEQVALQFTKRNGLEYDKFKLLLDHLKSHTENFLNSNQIDKDIMRFFFAHKPSLLV